MPRMLKHWDGATWQFRRLKYWDGSAWVPVALKWDATNTMAVYWANISLGWLNDNSIMTAQVPAGTGGVLVVFVGAGGGGTVATPITPADWTDLGVVGSTNGMRAWATDLANPDMDWGNAGYGEYAIMTARVEGGTMTGLLDNQHENGDWGTATLASPTVASAPADSIGLCAYYTDEANATEPYATWNNPDVTEAIDEDGEPTSTHCYGAAHQIGIPAGTWDPGTVTFGSNTVVTWFSVVIPKA